MLDIEFREVQWRVLVADDSRTAARAIRDAVHAFKIKTEIVTVDTGAACLEALASNTFDLAFVDLIFPDITGIEALCAARAAGANTFVTIVSGHRTEEHLAVAKALKAYDFLAKPLAEADIVRVLDTYTLVSQRRRLLLVDDSGTARRLMSRVLSSSIFRLEILEAADAVTGFETFVRERPDIVMLDLNLGALDGLSAYRIFKAHRPGARIVLISSDGPGLSRSNAEHVLLKPFDTADVDRIMHQVLGLPLPYGDDLDA
ncbi:response regulator [Mongoliimonas terrestris]|uniref:response regulator n=1 Tax=Mongoliimonas terrestris TaxID=1709001 RepID=UPI0009495D0F|nr:response regulator [Mongoliimonas terrestris]